jgi:hypothetical protein
MLPRESIVETAKLDNMLQTKEERFSIEIWTLAWFLPYRNKAALFWSFSPSYRVPIGQARIVFRDGISW